MFLGLRDDATTLGASAGAAALVGLSVFYNSPLFGVLFGVVLGALVTDFIQSRAWKRTVNREFAQKNAEQMYSPLYREIGSIVERVAGFNYLTGYDKLEAKEWV